MRILQVEPGPDFSVQDVHDGWRSGFVENGVTVRSLNLNDRLDFYSQVALQRDGEWVQALSTDAAVWMAAKGLVAAAFEFLPDVVVITSCFFVPVSVLDLLRSRGIKVVLLLTESPYEDGVQVARAEHADVCVVNDPTNLGQFKAVCPDSYYQGHSYNPARHWKRPAKPELKSDVAFVGTAFPSRIEFLEQVNWDGLDVVLGGNWNRLSDHSPLRPFVAHQFDNCLDNEEAVEAYSATKASFNLYRVESEDDAVLDGWACGPREIELAATRTFFARQSRPESDALFPMLPTFETPAELEQILRWAVAHDDEREKAADAARAAIVDRTFKNAAGRLLSLLAK